MTLNYGIFDTSDPQNPDRVYSAALLCRMMAKQIRDGIVHEDGNEMAVTVTDPPAMTVLVGTGTAMVQGRFCENDAALTLAVPTAHATYPRIDRVVVQLNASPGRTIDIVVKPGTAAPTPAAPALTRTAETWELSLAQVRVEAGVTSIVAAKITDERGNASLCGVAAPVYVPSSQLEVVGPVDMQGSTLTGLPAPSGATDAARKGYVDSELAAKIGGFGISQVAIDADKNWGGKSIENISSLSSSIYTSTNVKLLPIDPSFHPKTIRKTFTGNRGGKGTVDLGTFTIPAQYIDGSIIGVSGHVAVVMFSTYNAFAYIYIYINDVLVKSFTTPMNGATDFVGYVSCKGGDVVKVVLSGQPVGSQYDITSCSGNIVFFGEDVLPSVCVHPTW